MRIMGGRCFGHTVVVLVGLCVLTVCSSAEAQMRAGNAELTRATGRVEVLRSGRANWIVGAVGSRLVEGDQVRALAGGAAELRLPDGSTILVAENTRVAVTKLDYDGATRDRDVSFHLVAGKVRARVSPTAVSLARARQSSFNISTPNGVAAIRGTILILAHNPATGETLTFVLASPGQSPGAARASFVTRDGSTVIVRGDNFVRHVAGQLPGSPIPVADLLPAVQVSLETSQNPSTGGSKDLTDSSVNIPSYADTLTIVNSAGVGAGAGNDAAPVGGSTGVCPSCGQDLKFNASTTIKPQTCATPPCP